VFAKFDQDELIDDTIEEIYSDEKDYTEEQRKEKKKREFHQLLKWGFVYYPKDCADPSTAKKCVF